MNLYVSATVALWLLAEFVAFPFRAHFPGFWGVGVLLAVSILLELVATRSRGGDSEGTLSFIVQLASGLLFGAFWGGVLAAISTAFGQALRRRPPIRAAFNLAQRSLATIVAMLVYAGLGATTPPTYLQRGLADGVGSVIGSVAAFFAAAFIYFLLNSLIVSGVVALSTKRQIRTVWSTNSFWVFGYDIFASGLALVVAWLYLRFDGPDGASRIFFLLFLTPVVLVKHIYSKLNTLQSLYDQLDKAHHHLELSLREQLEMMVRSIEARDPYTSGHSRRVSALSKAIASDLGLAKEAIEEIQTAALLHDVGKIHAEFAPLLQKEGRLTQDEWEIMKTHATKSAELVGLFTRFHGAIQEDVRSHHERWDGKGYPDGLLAEAIPLGARIIMISDTIDAMTSDRPYRKALSFDKVVAELQKYKGIQFDPSLVEVTVMSVTVRRLVSDEDFLAEQTKHQHVTLTKARARPALRSQSSFLEAFRSSVSEVHGKKG